VTAESNVSNIPTDLKYADPTATLHQGQPTSFGDLPSLSTGNLYQLGSTEVSSYARGPNGLSPSSHPRLGQS